jgi:hypothetical protein
VLWFRDKAYLLKEPSIDRINNDGDYCFKNCQFIEKPENSIKDRRKPVIQFDLNGKFIREYSSINDVSRETHITIAEISRCCNNIRKQAHNFIWKFKTN